MSYKINHKFSKQSKSFMTMALWIILSFVFVALLELLNCMAHMFASSLSPGVVIIVRSCGTNFLGRPTKGPTGIVSRLIKKVMNQPPGSRTKFIWKWFWTTIRNLGVLRRLPRDPQRPLNSLHTHWLRIFHPKGLLKKTSLNN